MKTKKIVGTVTETLVVQKEVEVVVPAKDDAGVIEQAIRDAAYEKNIMNSGDHGWEGIETIEVNVDWNKKG
jgi:hypothetical protein